MGTWDFGPFDNDDASDWLYDLEDSSDTSVVATALSLVTDMDDDDLEAGDCANALAAAEIVAALLGRPLVNLPDNAGDWVEAHKTLDVSELVAIALAVVKRIRTNSELKELWDESEDAAQWYASLDDVTARLNGK